MGGFNVDLLKTDSHNDSNEFFSIYFTAYSAALSETLIDNIFFNSLEYYSLSGNLLIEIL